MQDDLLQTTGFQCIHFGVKAPEVQPLIDAGMRIFLLDAGRLRSEKAFLSHVRAAMQFPDYFGNNWDALEESLRDLSWAPASGYVLMIHNSRSLWKNQPEIAGRFVESWLFAAEQWATEAIPFHLVFLL